MRTKRPAGVAYTAGKGRGLTREWCMQWEDGLPAPDVVLFMDMDPDQSAARGGYGEERYENLEM